MTATQTQIRRGTSAQCAAMTPASSEVIHDTTNNRLRAGNGVRSGGFEIPNFDDIQRQAFGYGSAGGTGDVITLTLAPVLLAYAAGVSVEFKATANNTGATTININSLGAKNIYKMKSGTLTALESGDIKNGGIYRITYDGTQFQIKALDEAGGVAGMTLLAVASGGGTTYDFTSVITSTYDNYLAVIHSLRPSSASALWMRVSTNNGSSYLASSQYYASNISMNNGTNVGEGQAAGNEFILSASGAAPTTSSGISADVALFGMNATVEKIFKWHSAYVGNYSFVGGGYNTTGSAINAIRFMFASGNISSGSISLYGLRKTV